VDLVDPLPDGARIDLMRTVSVRAEDLSAFPQWRAALEATLHWIEAERACTGHGCGNGALAEKVWLTRTRGLSRLPPAQRVRQAVSFLDGLLEIDPTGPETSPWPTMPDILRDPGQGDRRLALARYYTLLAAGVRPDRLRIVNARDTVTLDRIHVILVTTPAGTMAVTPHGVTDLSEQGYHDFIPVYAFNHEARWLYFPARIASRDAVLP
jgi:hypothetical protein